MILTQIKFSMIYSITFVFKVLFLLMFVILTIYLLYLEYKIMDHKNKHLKTNLSNGNLDKDAVLESTGGNRNLSKILFTYLPALAGYFGVFQAIRRDRLVDRLESQYNQAVQELKEAKKNIIEREDLSLVEKTKYISQIDKLVTNTTFMAKSAKDRDKCIDELMQIAQLKIKLEKGENLTPKEQDLLTKQSLLENTKKYHEAEIERANSDIVKIKDEIDKSSFFGLNYEEIIGNLNQEEMLALCNLVFNQLILSNTINIILIIYGDYLIKRFDLINKYPKIANFIQIRRKLQEYYLKLSFVCIFLGVLPQIAMNIYLLLPKIQLILTGS